MSKRRSLFILLAILCLVLALYFTLINGNRTQKTVADQSQQSSLPTEEPELVIPEAPLGILGLIIILVAGFGSFAIINRREDKTKL